MQTIGFMVTFMVIGGVNVDQSPAWCQSKNKRRSGQYVRTPVRLFSVLKTSSAHRNPHSHLVTTPRKSFETSSEFLRVAPPPNKLPLNILMPEMKNIRKLEKCHGTSLKTNLDLLSSSIAEKALILIF